MRTNPDNDNTGKFIRSEPVKDDTQGLFTGCSTERDEKFPIKESKGIVKQ